MSKVAMQIVRVSAEIIEKHTAPFAVYQQRSNVRAPALKIATENVIVVTAWTSLVSDPSEMEGDRITPPPACPGCGNPMQFARAIPTDGLPECRRMTVRDAAWQ
jgi:hypothetical protein